MVRVHIPDSPRVLSAAAFATLRQEIETHLDPSIEVIALACAAPYAVECNSITSAMTLGSQAERCQNSCKPSKPNPYFDAASSRPFSDFGLRLTMLIPTGPTGLDKAMVGRGVRSDGAWPAQGVFIGEPLAAPYRPQR